MAVSWDDGATGTLKGLSLVWCTILWGMAVIWTRRDLAATAIDSDPSVGDRNFVGDINLVLGVVDVESNWCWAESFIGIDIVAVMLVDVRSIVWLVRAGMSIICTHIPRLMRLVIWLVTSMMMGLRGLVRLDRIAIFDCVHCWGTSTYGAAVHGDSSSGDGGDDLGELHDDRVRNKDKFQFKNY